MNEELDNKQNANYKTLKPLLKNMINNIYANKGIGKHIITFYEILDYLNILGKNYDDLKGIQNEYYSLMVIKKLDDNIQSVINRHMKSFNKNCKDISIYKAGTLKRNLLDKSLNDKYNEIREREINKIKETTKYYKYLDYNVSKSLNEELSANNQNWKEQKFYYNWVVDIQPNFKPFKITDDLYECRKELNKNFILKLKKDIGYNLLMDFSESYDYKLIRYQIERDVDEDVEDFNLYLKIIEGKYIPQELKKYMVIKDKYKNIYYDIYQLGSYLYDVNIIVKNCLI